MVFSRLLKCRCTVQLRTVTALSDTLVQTRALRRANARNVQPVRTKQPTAAPRVRFVRRTRSTTSREWSQQRDARGVRPALLRLQERPFASVLLDSPGRTGARASRVMLESTRTGGTRRSASPVRRIRTRCLARACVRVMSGIQDRSVARASRASPVSTRAPTARRPAPHARPTATSRTSLL